MLVGMNNSGDGSTEVCGPTSVASRKSEPKKLGTRGGTLEDWRQGSGKSGKQSGRRGNTLRDGR